jgi:hypothetical protein
LFKDKNGILGGEKEIWEVGREIFMLITLVTTS